MPIGNGRTKLHQTPTPPKPYPVRNSYLAGIGADDRVAVVPIRRVLVPVVLVRAKDVIGPEIKPLGARVTPTRRSGRHR